MTLTVLGRLDLAPALRRGPSAEACAVVAAHASGAVREGVRSFLADDSEFAVRTLAADGTAVLAAARRAPPRVLLLDAETKAPDAFEILTRLTVEMPSIRTLLLTAGERPALVLRALAAGASGHLDAGSGADAYQHAVRQAARGERVLSPMVRDALVHRSLGSGEPQRPADLTAREFQVLRLVARGLATAAIARDLDVSASTVRTYKAALRSKLRLDGDAALARYAFDNGFG